MPKYDIEKASGESQTLRAKSDADACARAGIGDAVVAPEADVQGWREVAVEGEVVARVREHNRMRFRRD
ncbi:MAG: hypothetical protein AAFQ43_11900 [Bacteroidota bacterium]